MERKTKIRKKTEKTKSMVSTELKNTGVEIDLPQSYDELEKESVGTIEKLLKDKPKAIKMWRLLTKDEEVRAIRSKERWSPNKFRVSKKIGFKN